LHHKLSHSARGHRRYPGSDKEDGCRLAAQLNNVPETASSSLYHHELSVALDLACNAGATILEYYNRPIEVLEKFDFDIREPVTLADRVANELIVAGLHEHFPDDGILAEESEDTERRPASVDG
jgi:hypothetical protein